MCAVHYDVFARVWVGNGGGGGAGGRDVQITFRVLDCRDNIERRTGGIGQLRQLSAAVAGVCKPELN